MLNYFDAAIGIRPAAKKLSDIDSSKIGNIGYITQKQVNLGQKQGQLTISPYSNFRRRY